MLLCFLSGSILHSEPDVYDLLNLLAEIEHEWYGIGLTLRVPAAKLEDLLQQERLPSKVKLFKVLNCWINQRTTAVTWNSIITAVKSFKENRIAQTIKAYVLKDNITDDISTSRVSVEEQNSDNSML